MENIFKISKRGIIAILTLCILLSIAGTCFSVTAMAAEITVTVEETAVATEEITTVVVEESTISTVEPVVSTEDTTVVAEENTQELVPRKARACWGTLDEALNYYMSRAKDRDLVVTALVEDGMFEENIMYPVALYSEMLWDCDADIDTLLSQVALRDYVDFA